MYSIQMFLVSHFYDHRVILHSKETQINKRDEIVHRKFGLCTKYPVKNVSFCESEYNIVVVIGTKYFLGKCIAEIDR